MKILQISVVLFCNLLCVDLLAQQIDLKGVPFGSSFDEVSKRFPGQQCQLAPLGYKTCDVVGETFAGQAPTKFSVSYDNDKLCSYFVIMKGRHIDAVFDALSEKIGRPTSESRRPQSKNFPRDALWKWEPQHITWESADWRIEASFSGSDTVENDNPAWNTRVSARAHVCQAAWERSAAERRRQAAEAAKKDM